MTVLPVGTPIVVTGDSLHEHIWSVGATGTIVECDYEARDLASYKVRFDPNQQGVRRCGEDGVLWYVLCKDVIPREGWTPPPPPPPYPVADVATRVAAKIKEKRHAV